MDSTGSNSSIQDADVATSRADIVVAITSYNDVRTIGAVARAVRDGLARYASSSATLIVLADAGSADGTREAAREVVGPAALIEVEYAQGTVFTELPYHGHPHRVAALHAVLETAYRLEAKVCIVLDAAVDAVRPQWIEQLVAPILTDGFDYASAHYVRQIHEGALTKSIVYPMFRALYGVRLRQPAAAEFGCSRRALTHYLAQPFWDLEQASAGIDLWLSVATVCGEFRMCEVALGSRGVVSRGQQTDLSTTLAQVVGALFADLTQRVDVWQRVRGSEPIPIFGPADAAVPSASTLDVEGLIDSFRLGCRELREVWTWVLPPRTIVELRKLSEAPDDRFTFDDRLWAGIVYDFALGYALRVMPHDHLLRSLTPLYCGWLGSFVQDMDGAALPQVDERVERGCLGFEAEKRYLISRWRWPERLR